MHVQNHNLLDTFTWVKQRAKDLASYANNDDDDDDDDRKEKGIKTSLKWKPASPCHPLP